MRYRTTQDRTHHIFTKYSVIAFFQKMYKKRIEPCLSCASRHSLVVFVLFFLLSAPLIISAQTRWSCKDGYVSFQSNAELEAIQAHSNQLIGVIDLVENKFAFSVDMASFTGFNSALQEEHFNESYVETGTFPKATFSGKLIDIFNPQLSKQKVRSKGIFTVHGVGIERIIEIEIHKVASGLSFHAAFNIPLAQHQIRIPRIVYKKIAETVSLSVQGNLKVEN
jgi:hypothetical protein